jgi:cold shock CspA family protein
MQVPLELTFRGVERTPALEQLIAEQAGRLERFCPYITSCRVTVEKPQLHQRVGNEWRVRVEAHVPPGHDLVAVTEPGNEPMHVELRRVIHDTFQAVERQLKALVEKQRVYDTRREREEPHAVVARLFRDEGYGFLRPLDGGPELYFHRNAVLHEDFERLEVGAEVRYDEELGREGPQATTVQLLTKRG